MISVFWDSLIRRKRSIGDRDIHEFSCTLPDFNFAQLTSSGELVSR